MNALTISRQLGSLGDELAQQLAEHLGWRQVCRDLINQAALAAGVPQVALAEIDELGLLGLHPTAAEWQIYRHEVERIIGDLADQGQVIVVGRGGQMVLHDRAEVLRVRVVAPFEVRQARLQQTDQISAGAARARLEKSHQTRSHYLRRAYQADLDDPTLYHLVINTGRLTLTQAMDLVLLMMAMAVDDQPAQDRYPRGAGS